MSLICKNSLISDEINQIFFRCPKCYLIPYIKIEYAYNILIYNCPNNHFDSERIDIIYNKLISNNKKCYLCSSNSNNNNNNIKKYCIDCYKFFCNKHIKNKNHNLIDVDLIDNICLLHLKRIKFFCKENKRSFCEICMKNFNNKNNNKIYENYYLNQNQIDNYENIIIKLNKIIEPIINNKKIYQNIFDINTNNKINFINIMFKIIVNIFKMYKYSMKNKIMNFNIINNLENNFDYINNFENICIDILNPLEPKQFIYLKEEFKKNITNYNEFYVINKKWLNQWKIYTNYKNIKNNNYNFKEENNNNNNENENFPGEINNNNLIINNSNILKLKNENYVVFKQSQKNNIKLINKTMFDFLYNKYKGGPILKFQIKKFINNKPIIEIDYFMITLFILDNKDVNNIIKSYQIFINKNKLVKECIEYIINIINEYKLINNNDNNIININNYINYIKLYEFEEDIENIENNFFDNNKIDINYLIKNKININDIKGNNLDNFTKYKLSEVFIEDRRTFFSKDSEEIQNINIFIDNAPFIIKDNDNNKIIISKCKFCSNNHILLYNLNNKNFYCNKICYQKEINFQKQNNNNKNEE